MSKLVPVVVAAVLGLAGAGAWFALRDAPSATDGPDTAPSRGTAPKGDDPSRDRRETEPKPEAADEEGPPIPEMAPEPTPGAGVTFRFPDCTATETVDWTRIGIQFRRAQKVIRRAAARVRQGDQEPLGPGGGVGESYYQVMFTSREFVRETLPTQLDMNSPVATLLSYPPYQSNAIAATLAAWGRPLSEEQVKAIREIYGEYHFVWRDVRSRAPKDSWPIDLIAEASMARAALQPKLEAILDEKQRSALWPPSVKGRVGLDPFSPALLWHGRIELVRCPEGESLAKCWADAMVMQLNIQPEEFDARSAICLEWFAKMPKSIRQGLKGPLARAELPLWDDISEFVAGTPELMRRLAEGYTRTDLPLQRSPRLLLPVSVTR